MVNELPRERAMEENQALTEEEALRIVRDPELWKALSKTEKIRVMQRAIEVAKRDIKNRIMNLADPDSPNR
jgi:hypothetical protein